MLEGCLRNHLTFTVVNIIIIDLEKFKVFSSCTQDISEFSSQLSHISHHSSFFFPTVSFGDIFRTATKATYDLAKLNLAINEDVIWLEEIPQPVVSAMLSEFSQYYDLQKI